MLTFNSRTSLKKNPNLSKGARYNFIHYFFKSIKTITISKSIASTIRNIQTACCHN